MSNRLRLLLAILFVSLVATFVWASITPANDSQNQNNNASQRGQCEQDCTRAYQTCRDAPNANQSECRQAMDACKTRCKDVKPKPRESVSPTPSPSGTATPTETPSSTPTP